jgi:hypothetical protein
MRPVALLCLVLLACACSRQKLPELDGEVRPEIDFSGSWELNSQRSDRLEDNLRQLQLSAVAQARERQTHGRRFDGGFLGLPSYELIRLTESISRTALLEIEQSDGYIEIEREDEFPLTCTFGTPMPQFASDEFGVEVCGWDEHQLVFAFQMPGGLTVYHRITLSPMEDQLNIATTVRSRGVGQSFTLNRVYDRFEPLQEQYECRVAVGGGRTCRRNDGTDALTP